LSDSKNGQNQCLLVLSILNRPGAREKGGLSLMPEGGRKSSDEEGWSRKPEFLFNFWSDKSTKGATNDGDNIFFTFRNQ